MNNHRTLLSRNEMPSFYQKLLSLLLTKLCAGNLDINSKLINMLTREYKIFSFVLNVFYKYYLSKEIHFSVDEVGSFGPQLAVVNYFRLRGMMENEKISTFY